MENNTIEWIGEGWYICLFIDGKRAAFPAKNTFHCAKSDHYLAAANATNKPQTLHIFKYLTEKPGAYLHFNYWK